MTNTVPCTLSFHTLQDLELLMEEFPDFKENMMHVAAERVKNLSGNGNRFVIRPRLSVMQSGGMNTDMASVLGEELREALKKERLADEATRRASMASLGSTDERKSDDGMQQMLADIQKTCRTLKNEMRDVKMRLSAQSTANAGIGGMGSTSNGRLAQ